MRSMPAAVQDVFGAALLDVEYGDVPMGARVYGEGLPTDILKIVEDHDGNTYRAAYTVAFPGVAYVLNVFQKKAKQGRETPQADKSRVLERYRAARAHYAEHYAAHVRDPRRPRRSS